MTKARISKYLLFSDIGICQHHISTLSHLQCQLSTCKINTHIYRVNSVKHFGLSLLLKMRKIGVAFSNSFRFDG